MSEKKPTDAQETLAQLYQGRAADAERERDEARRERDAAIASAKARDTVIAKFLGRVKLPDHIAEGSKNLDAHDRLDYVLGRSGDWSSPVFEKHQPISREDKAARAISARQYM